MKPVDELQGREMDAAVAEEVMGWMAQPVDDGFGTVNWVDGNTVYTHAPHFSTNIAAAWEVVEKMDGEVGVWRELPPLKRPWACTTGNCRPVWGDTAPLAICRAALKAVRAAS